MYKNLYNDIFLVLLPVTNLIHLFLCRRIVNKQKYFSTLLLTVNYKVSVIKKSFLT